MCKHFAQLQLVYFKRTRLQRKHFYSPHMMNFSVFKLFMNDGGLLGVANVLSSVKYFRTYFGKSTFFEQLKSDWSKPKKAAIITVTAIILVFGYCI